MMNEEESFPQGSLALDGKVDCDGDCPDELKCGDCEKKSRA
jgi:hypothetical protein